MTNWDFETSSDILTVNLNLERQGQSIHIRMLNFINFGLVTSICGVWFKNVFIEKQLYAEYNISRTIIELLNKAPNRPALYLRKGFMRKNCDARYQLKRRFSWKEGNHY